MASISFQAIDELTRPLASVARIAEKGNTVVLRGADKISFIENDKTGTRISLHIENGVYVMNVDVVKEESPFGRLV